MVHTDNGIAFSTKNEVSYQAMKRHGGSLDACHRVKEDSQERLHTVGFQLYDTFPKRKS